MIRNSINYFRIALLLVGIIFVLNSPLLFSAKNNALQFQIGPDYGYYNLYRDTLKAQSEYHWGGNIGITNIIPGIGINFRGAYLEYSVTQYNSPFTYRYVPLVLATSFDLLPFLEKDWVKLNLQTGFGIYLWQGRVNDQVFVLPSGEKMDEKDLGFYGGIELTLKPIRFLGFSLFTQYHYITSSNIYKYGYFDKDEKLWANGLGLKIFLP